MSFAPIQADFYKTGHKDQYPKGTSLVYSNLTARSGKYSNVPNSKGVIFVGLQLFIKDYLIREWNKSFFSKSKKKVVKKYHYLISPSFPISVQHLEDLHDLGYLPISIKALPEGSFVPYKVPMLTIKNTIPEFYWLTNYIESVMSAELWGIINSATTAREYYRVFLNYAHATCDDAEHVDYQGHDFSFRGMFGRDAAAKSGVGHLCSFKGTDSIPSLEIIRKYYAHNESSTTHYDIGGSVPVTEHSCMSSSISEIMRDDDLMTSTIDYFKQNFINFDIENKRLVAEYIYFKRLITEIYPTGTVSIVSDTYDFWGVVTQILPALKDIILKRPGTVVIRPDSGDPVDIICGTKEKCTYFLDIRSADEKGLIECLWHIFGGTVNQKGYKVLDSHIGAIYGDSITLERQTEILEKLRTKEFASSNIILGIGSFTYQHTSRDTHGIAMKSTYCEVNGKGINIFKNPKTDDGTKKSAEGLLMVSYVNGKYELKDQCNKAEEARGCLEEVFSNGLICDYIDIDSIRERIYNDLVS